MFKRISRFDEMRIQMLLREATKYESYVRFSDQNLLFQSHPSGPKPVQPELSTDDGVRYSRRQEQKTPEEMMADFIRTNNIEGLFRYMETTRERSFVECVMEHIREKGVKDSAVYKAAGIDRRLFSKMMSDVKYRPSKDTALSMALGLQLALPEAVDLLNRAGFTLSHSDRRDVLLEFFFKFGVYNLLDVNAVLNAAGERIIGRT